ncbi:MAG TPA: YIP1 family protein [Methanocella sp.]|uniref:YIP1 family protein n=1 Tax=Methanocella sp. TaxID=2052833 RepID=UPI002B8DAF45|nr:YIP1 family protein [Methanocella sp.]HTY90941.1 YIP1 family protein [Methanocella sp.]
MQFVERIKGMFTKPEETIKDILKEPRTEEPLMIIGVYAIIVLISGYISSTRMGIGAAVLNLVISFALVLIGWPIATGVVHVLALFLGGQGKYNPDMLNAIGYTYLVKYIPALIGIVLLLFLPTMNLGMPQITPTMSMDQIKEAMQPYIAMMEQIYFSPIFILSLVISYLGLIWSCYLGSLAVKIGDKTSAVASYIAVFAPMVVYIIFNLLAVYGSYLLVKMLYG